MKTLIQASLGFLLVAVVSNTSQAKEWRGLEPLRSTRADVIRLVNQCSDQTEACRFTLDKEDVYILFSEGLGAKYSECVARLPSGTIMLIQVRSRNPLKLSDLNFDKRAFKSFNPSAPLKRGLIGYRNQDGLVIQVYKKSVVQIVYLANDSDRNLCAEYYEAPESFVARPFNHYDSMYVDGPAVSRQVRSSE